MSVVCHLPVTLLHSEWPKLHRVLAISDCNRVDSERHKKAYNEIYIFKFSENVAIYGECKDQRSRSADPDEAAHFEPPHWDIMLFANLTTFSFDTLSASQISYSVSRLLTIIYSAMIDGVVAGIDVYSNTLSVSKVSKSSQSYITNTLNETYQQSTAIHEA